MTKKHLAYVSGPYWDSRGTAYVEQNIRRAEEVAQELWRRGYAVICPHANTRHFDGVVPSEEFIAGDLVMVEHCDIVVVLDGWQNSEGSKIEVNHAREREIPVVSWSGVVAAEKVREDLPEAVAALLP